MKKYKLKSWCIYILLIFQFLILVWLGAETPPHSKLILLIVFVLNDRILIRGGLKDWYE